MSTSYIHPKALVETNRIGCGTRIWAFVHVLEGAQIGAHCNIGDHSFVEAGAIIGDNVTIKNGNSIWEGVTLEDGVFVGPRVFFTNDLRPRSPRLEHVRERYANKGWLSKTLVRRGASLGAGAVILAGRTIGEYAMVAAGSVVTKNVPAHALVLGNPARVVGWVCQCGLGVDFQRGIAICGPCGLVYIRDENKITLVSTPGIPNSQQLSVGMSD